LHWGSICNNNQQQSEDKPTDNKYT